MRAWEILVSATVILVVVYLMVFYNKGASDVINAGATGWSNVIKAFQGRN